jgi:hypothetical protein
MIKYWIRYIAEVKHDDGRVTEHSGEVGIERELPFQDFSDFDSLKRVCAKEYAQQKGWDPTQVKARVRGWQQVGEERRIQLPGVL